MPNYVMNTTDPTRPDWHRPEYVKVSRDLQLVHDLLEGTRRMHKYAEERKYIRKWKDEDPAIYRIRSTIETVFGGLERTLGASVGMLFAHEPEITWNAGEARMAPHWENIDGKGTKGHVFAKRFSEASIRDGVGIIVVDHPPAPVDEGGRELVVVPGTEDNLGLRPMWRWYGRQRLINWRTDVIQNHEAITLLVFHEPELVNVNRYGVEREDRYRILRLGPVLLADETEPRLAATWQVLRRVEGQGGEPEFRRVAGGVYRNAAGDPKPELPVAVAYTGTTNAQLTADIPLLPVAWANLSHWRQSTNLTFYREVAAFPQPVLKGKLPSTMGANNQPIPGRLKVGPMVPVMIEAEGDFEWTELTGTSMEQVERGVTEKLDQMGTMGVGFLTPQKRAAETAEAKRIDAVGERATLATAAQGIEDAVNRAYEHHAWYLGIERASSPVLKINTDFESTLMDPQTMVAYIDAVERAGLPVEVLLEAWKAGGRLPPDTDVRMMALEMSAERAAREAAKEAEVAANLEAAAAGAAA